MYSLFNQQQKEEANPRYTQDNCSQYLLSQ